MSNTNTSSAVNTNTNTKSKGGAVMKLYLQLWNRQKDGRRGIDVTEYDGEEEKVIWSDSFYQKQGESVMAFCKRFLETEMKEKYEEAECVLAYGMNHCFHRSLWIKEAK